MSEDSLDTNRQTDSNNSEFNADLYIDISQFESIESKVKETAEGLELLKVSSLDKDPNEVFLQTPIVTPKTSGNFNFISSDLMKRLDQNSPLKARNLLDGMRKFSEFSLVNCESEGDHTSGSKLAKQRSSEQSERSVKQSRESRVSRSNSENENKPNSNLSTRNYKLKAVMMPPQHLEEEYFGVSRNDVTMSNPSLKDEPKSLFNNSFRNFQQAGSYFSPTYRTKQTKKVRGDSSPIYSYYDGTAECLSQTFFDEFNKSNNDQFMSKNNFIKRSSSNLQMEEANLNFKKSNSNMFEDMLNVNNAKDNQGPRMFTFNKNEENFARKHTNDSQSNFREFMEPSISFGGNLPNFYPDNVQNYQNYQNVKNMQNMPNLPKQQNAGYKNPAKMMSNPNGLNNSVNFNHTKNLNEYQNQMQTNHSNQVNNQSNNSSVSQNQLGEDDYSVEMFGRKGWICEMCNNFNYETRMKCNRCGVNKMPKKIKNKSTHKNSNDEDEDGDKKKKKPFVERLGDWVCIKCKNLNFSFRVVCNRCQMPKQENDKMFDNYMGNLMTYAKNNDGNVQRPMQGSHHFAQNNPGYVNYNSISINNNYTPFPQNQPFNYMQPNNQQVMPGMSGQNLFNSSMGMGNMSNVGNNGYMGVQYGMDQFQEQNAYFNGVNEDE